MNKFAKWIVFGVAFAIAPLIADYVIQSMHPKPNVSFSLGNIIEKGELLLVAAAISGAGVGELIGSGKDWLIFKLVSGGSCVIILLVSALLYSSVASDVRLQTLYDKDSLISWSIYLFIFTIISCAGCILVAED